MDADIRSRAISDLYHADHLTGRQFELYMADVLNGAGYHSVVATRATNDGGLDAIGYNDNDRKVGWQFKKYGRGEKVPFHAVEEAMFGAMLYKTQINIVLTNRCFSRRTWRRCEIARRNRPDMPVYLVDRKRLFHIFWDYEQGKEQIRSSANMSFTSSSASVSQWFASTSLSQSVSWSASCSSSVALSYSLSQSVSLSSAKSLSASVSYSANWSSIESNQRSMMHSISDSIKQSESASTSQSISVSTSMSQSVSSYWSMASSASASLSQSASVTSQHQAYKRHVLLNYSFIDYVYHMFADAGYQIDIANYQSPLDLIGLSSDDVPVGFLFLHCKDSSLVLGHDVVNKAVSIIQSAPEDIHRAFVITNGLFIYSICNRVQDKTISFYDHRNIQKLPDEIIHKQTVMKSERNSRASSASLSASASRNVSLSQSLSSIVSASLSQMASSIFSGKPQSSKATSTNREDVSTYKLCPECHTHCGVHDKFCMRCGYHFANDIVICPNCHNVCYPSDEYCFNCGHRLR